MFSWKFTVKVEECVGIQTSPLGVYTMVARFDNKFSAPTDAATISGNRLRFKSVLTLEFSTEDKELPSSNIQIMLVCKEEKVKGERSVGGKEDIIGMATIKIAFPLPKELQSTRTHQFDKSLNQKASFKASFALERSQIDPQIAIKEDQTLPSDALEEILSLEREKNEAYQNHLKFLHSELGEDLIQDRQAKDDRLQEILKERNELYKISEDLYDQLKKCMAERDQYLKELREKELTQEQTREELHFLRMKLEESEGTQQQVSPLQMELEALRDDNSDLRRALQQREDEVRELRRQVRQSLRAVEQFKKEALEARSELINKESELSVISRQSRYLDPYECIQELQLQLENRRLEDPFQFKHQEEITKKHTETAVRELKKANANLFTQLLQKVKPPRDKEWLLHQKIDFQRKIDSLLAGD